MVERIPRVTVDGFIYESNRVLLIRRKNPPFQGRWALPGGFIEYGETTEEAVVREVLEETGLKTRVKKVLGVYSDPKRDPRGHTITVVYLLEQINGTLTSGDDAGDVKFFNIDDLPELSFDHATIINDALQKQSLEM
ncbi:MAG: NUDIX hydrolase [Methanobacteriota archaeon]